MDEAIGKITRTNASTMTNATIRANTANKKNTKIVNAININNVINNLKKNNMDACFVKNIQEAVSRVLSMIPPKSKVGFGGSITIHELDLLDKAREKGCEVFDWSDPDKTKEENTRMRKMSFFADVYLSSSNAVSESGELINIDGRGNRVAAITYGPESVIIIIGKNKLVKDQREGIERIKKVSAPLNAKRLNKNTPCVVKGICQDCKSQDRICCTTVVHGWQCVKNRIKVIIVNEKLGY